MGKIMVEMELHITGGIKEKAARFPKALTSAMIEVVKRWHANFLPKHFKSGAAIKYGYKQRTPKYQMRKRKKGSPPALVYTGDSKARLTRSAFYRVTGANGTATGRHIVGSQIRYFWMTPPNHPNKPKELKSVTAAETNTMSDFVLKAVPDSLEKINKKVIIR